MGHEIVRKIPHTQGKTFPKANFPKFPKPLTAKPYLFLIKVHFVYTL